MNKYEKGKINWEKDDNGIVCDKCNKLFEWDAITCQTCAYTLCFNCNYINGKDNGIIFTDGIIFICKRRKCEDLN